MKLWFPYESDYDKAILDKLKTIRLSSGHPIYVSTTMVEKEGEPDVSEKVPAILVYRYDRELDTERELSQIKLVADETEETITTMDKPTPVKLFYEITLVNRYLEHENEMIRQFEKLFPYRGFLTVVSPEGEEQHYDFFFKQFINNDTHQQVPQGGTSSIRQFRKIYRYHLYTEIPMGEEIAYKKPFSTNGDSPVNVEVEQRE